MVEYNPVVEEIIFNGIAYRRYPNAKNASDRNYYRPHAGYIRKGIGALHREIWKAAYGDIPYGYEIHHKDLNPLNNNIENLECLSKHDHLEYHTSLMPEWRKEALRKGWRGVVIKAIGWHKSAEGREWHRLHGIAMGRKRKSHEFQCEQCGSTYETKSTSNHKFCSNKCKSAHRRLIKADFETRTCDWCKTEFMCNKYLKTQCCSLTCSALAREAKKPLTDAGRLRISQTSKERWVNAVSHQFTCDECGQTFESTANHGHVRFCSPKCRARDFRKRHKA